MGLRSRASGLGRLLRGSALRLNAMLVIMLAMGYTAAQQCNSFDDCDNMTLADCLYQGAPPGSDAPCEFGGDGIGSWYCDTSNNCFDSDFCRRVRHSAPRACSLRTPATPSPNNLPTGNMH